MRSDPEFYNASTAPRYSDTGWVRVRPVWGARGRAGARPVLTEMPVAADSSARLVSRCWRRARKRGPTGARMPFSESNHDILPFRQDPVPGGWSRPLIQAAWCN